MRELHASSPVAGKPFVVCDSGSMEALLKGDGATGRRPVEGRSVYVHLSELAQGGTIFFPELGLFSLGAQAEVLHLLERLASERGERVRVIASASGDLQALVASGVLRSELRERIGGIELAVAPLRERLDDMEAVASQILARAAERSGGGRAATISHGALRELQRRGWPGNDRELESTLRMAALSSGGGVIEERHLPEATSRAESAAEVSAGVSVSSMRLQDVVDAHVQGVLRRCDCNKLKAAEVLGISRSTLYRMLEAASVPSQAV